MNEKFKRKNPKYTMIPNHVLWDTTLSLDSKGLYAYLCSFLDPTKKRIAISTDQLDRDICNNHDLVRDWLIELSSKQLISVYKYDDMWCEVSII